MGRYDEFKTISELVAEWKTALEKYGDIMVRIDYDNQYYWSPSPLYFRLVKQKDGQVFLEADNG